MRDHLPAETAWLRTTIEAVREVMLKRLASKSLESEQEKEVQLALDELETMWDELQGLTTLLNREYERYAAFFDYAPDAYVITDNAGRVREANRAASELLLLERDDIVGKSLTSFLPAAEKHALLSRLLTVTNQSEPKPCSWRSEVAIPGGATVLAEFSVRAIPLRKSGVGGLCWLIRPL